MKAKVAICALAAGLLMQSCDKVEPPFLESQQSSSETYYGYIELQGIPGIVSGLQFLDNFKTDSTNLIASWNITTSGGTSTGTITFQWHGATATLNGSGPAGTPVLLNGNVTLAEGGLYGTLSFDYEGELSTSGSEKGIVVGYVYQNVLVEDYTGHFCGNCPRATRKAEEFKALYGDRFIVVGVHAGFFSWTIHGPPYTYDFQTAAGTQWDTDFGISNAGNPNGMVNRKVINGNRIVTFTAWGPEASNIYAAKGVNPDMSIRIDNDFDDASRNLDVTVRSAVLKDLSGTYKLGVYLVEDSVVKWQKDYDASPEDVEFYVHRDVLRGDINGIYGEQIIAGNAMAESIITKNYSINIDNEYVAEHCHVVAMIFDENTKEVIQAYEKKVID